MIERSTLKGNRDFYSTLSSSLVKLVLCVLIIGPIIAVLMYLSLTQSPNRVFTTVPVARNADTLSSTILNNNNNHNNNTNRNNNNPAPPIVIHHHHYNDDRYPYTREFSDNQLERIYSRYVRKPPNYLNQYQWLSNNTWWIPHCEKVKIMCRTIECTEFYHIMKRHNLTHFDKCLSVNSWGDPEWKVINCTHRVDARYKRNAVDGQPYIHGDAYIMNLTDKGTWDFFMANQMLEHFYDPKLVMHRLNEHLKVGGYMWVTVPVVNIPHMTPIHFYHLQPMGLATLAISTGFQIIELGWWGNEEYIRYLYKEGWWPNHKHFEQYEPVKNQWRHIVQTWALLKKVDEK